MAPVLALLGPGAFWSFLFFFVREALGRRGPPPGRALARPGRPKEALPMRFPTLTRNNDFRRAYAKGKSAAGYCLVLYAVKNRRQGTRVGITCSKKVGNAVARNRARRVIRAALAAVLPPAGVGNWDLVLVARSCTPAQKSTQVAAVLQKLLAKLALPSPGSAPRPPKKAAARPETEIATAAASKAAAEIATSTAAEAAAETVATAPAKDTTQEAAAVAATTTAAATAEPAAKAAAAATTKRSAAAPAVALPQGAAKTAPAPPSTQHPTAPCTASFGPGPQPPCSPCPAPGGPAK